MLDRRDDATEYLLPDGHATNKLPLPITSLPLATEGAGTRLRRQAGCRCSTGIGLPVQAGKPATYRAAAPIISGVKGRREAGAIRLGRDGLQLYEQSGYGRPGGDGLSLVPVEALYLVHRGRLELPGETFESLLAEFSADPHFLRSYLVYRDLRERGYVVQTGPHDFRVFRRGQRPGFGAVAVHGPGPLRTGSDRVRPPDRRGDVDRADAEVPPARGRRRRGRADLLRGQAPVPAGTGVGRAGEGGDGAPVRLGRDRGRRGGGRARGGRIRNPARRSAAQARARRGALPARERVARLSRTGPPKAGTTAPWSGRSMPRPARRARSTPTSGAGDTSRGPGTSSATTTASTARRKTHSEMLAHALPGGAALPMSVISRSVRLAHSVKKKMLFGCVHTEGIFFVEFARIKL